MRKDANILSCEMASLTVKKVSWGEDAFCVHDEIFMQFGKKSGEQANVIKKKLVVWASLFFTFPFFQVGISFEANYLIAPNSFFFMHLHYT